jgi:processive 1,2-diacylglycerol beta-glucosyltransferase
MAERSMCPGCGKSYPWSETVCPECGQTLKPSGDAAPVAVFQTEDPGALALARIALEGAHIEYIVSRIGSARSLSWRDEFGTSPELGVPAEIVVPAQDANQAHDLLSDLESAPDASGAAVIAPAADTSAPAADRGPIELHDSLTGQLVGHITDAQLEFLRDQLEEESTTDRDYYFDRPTIDLLESKQADPSLLALLRRALGARDGIEIVWKDTRD